MADAESSKSKPKPKSGSGCLPKLAGLVLLVGTLGLGTALFFVAMPQDLSGLDDHKLDGDPAKGRDLTKVIQNSLDRGYPLKLKQEEINLWLDDTLHCKQGGILEGQVSLKRVRVRLAEDVAEVILERELFGSSFTVSMFLTIEQLEEDGNLRTHVHLHGGPFADSVKRPMRGGRFGRLVVPQGFLILVMPAFEELSKQFPDEIRTGFEEMARIRIGDGVLELDPRDPSSEMPGLMPGAR